MTLTQCKWYQDHSSRDQFF